MKKVTKILADLKFGIKVGGGFLAVLLLTAIVAGVGFIAVHNLSSSIVIYDLAAFAAKRVQSTSLVRENYLNNPTPDLVSAVHEEIKHLDTALNDIAKDVEGDADAAAQIATAQADVRHFEEIFSGLVLQIEKQSEKLGVLQNSTSELQELSNQISTVIAGLAKQKDTDAEEANSKLFDSFQLQKYLYDIKTKVFALELFYTQNNGNIQGKDLDQYIEIMQTVNRDAELLSATQINGIAADELNRLHQSSLVLMTALQNLTRDLGFSEAYEARLAVGKAINDVKTIALNVLDQINPVVSDAKNDFVAASSWQDTVKKIADKTTELKELALSTRAETLQLFGSFGSSDFEIIENQITGLSALHKELVTETLFVPTAAQEVNQIPAAVSKLEASFQEMLQTKRELQTKRSELDRLTQEINEDILAISGAQSKAAKDAATSARLQISITVLIALLGSAGLVFLLNLVITRPIKTTTDVMARLANGDNDVDIQGVDRGDEIGDMSRTLQVFRDNAIERAELQARSAQDAEIRQARQTKIDQLIQNFRTKAADALGSVEATAGGLDDTARSLSESARDTAGYATKTKASTTETTYNVQTVASAAEELAASIGEISRQISHTTQIVDRATLGTRETNTKIEGLAEAATKIGEVVTLIQAIAEQTNLLALNATIEAARAGDAGKGFAVVASEVKELATQTSLATEEISSQIGEIQNATKESVVAIAEISKTMTEVNSNTTAIASAVEQQGAATTEISQNVQRAAEGTESVSASMNELSSAVDQTSSSANMVLSASEELSTKTDELKQEVDDFLAKVSNS